jgi:hypothetical protein
VNLPRSSGNSSSIRQAENQKSLHFVAMHWYPCREVLVVVEIRFWALTSSNANPFDNEHNQQRHRCSWKSKVYKPTYLPTVNSKHHSEKEYPNEFLPSNISAQIAPPTGRTFRTWTYTQRQRGTVAGVTSHQTCCPSSAS